ncbi:MAG: hypothetical protein DMG67_13905, partial [Acidobacteria bacterium]
RVVDMNQVQDLALNGRNYIQLVSLVPGVALIDEDQMAVTTSLSATNQSVNGTRPDQNHLTVDGGFDLDSGSNGSQINNVGVDFIQEVNIKTSNFSAEYGRNSGGAINAVTRSGGKSFHGGVLEFLRNDKLDATNFFAPTGLNGQKQKKKLRFNDFGWNLGGPILKNKLFFFVGEEWKIIRQTTAPTRKGIRCHRRLPGQGPGRRRQGSQPAILSWQEWRCHLCHQGKPLFERHMSWPADPHPGWQRPRGIVHCHGTAAGGSRLSKHSERQQHHLSGG